MTDFRTRKRTERQLDRYAPFVRTKAFEFASRYLLPDQKPSRADVDDFIQVGTEAAWRASIADPNLTKPHAYYRTAITNALINHSQRVQHKPNGAYIEDGEVKTLDYQPQTSADEHWSGILWSDADLN